jgi:LysR family transcriptional regulator (chromosome initiation inhibitor)
MLDYRLLEAFAAVLEERGFERAADRLCITQSAVSQRIKQLEDELGRVLVVRESPPRATEAGERLLRLYRQVASLEQETIGEFGAKGEADFQHIPIAVNTDSLAVWLLDAVIPFLRRNPVAFEVIVDEQDQTLSFLKTGAVAGCISPQEKAIQGCSSTRIGTLQYLLVASPAFADQWFSWGFDRESASRAPVVHMNRDDKMQYRALESCFGDPQVVPPAHYIPSTEKYFDIVVAGVGYGLISAVQAAPAIARGELVEVDARARVDVTLYWHCWNQYSALLGGLTEAILSEGARILSAARSGS